WTGRIVRLDAAVGWQVRRALAMKATASSQLSAGVAEVFRRGSPKCVRDDTPSASPLGGATSSPPPPSRRRVVGRVERSRRVRGKDGGGAARQTWSWRRARAGKSGGRALHRRGTLGPPVLLRGRTPPVVRGTPDEDASELEEREGVMDATINSLKRDEKILPHGEGGGCHFLHTSGAYAGRARTPPVSSARPASSSPRPPRRRSSSSSRGGGPPDFPRQFARRNGEEDDVIDELRRVDYLERLYVAGIVVVSPPIEGGGGSARAELETEVVNEPELKVVLARSSRAGARRRRSSTLAGALGSASSPRRRRREFPAPAASSTLPPEADDLVRSTRRDRRTPAPTSRPRTQDRPEPRATREKLSSLYDTSTSNHRCNIQYLPGITPSESESEGAEPIAGRRLPGRIASLPAFVDRGAACGARGEDHGESRLVNYLPIPTTGPKVGPDDARRRGMTSPGERDARSRAWRPDKFRPWLSKGKSWSGSESIDRKRTARRSRNTARTLYRRTRAEVPPPQRGMTHRKRHNPVIGCGETMQQSNGPDDHGTVEQIRCKTSIRKCAAPPSAPVASRPRLGDTVSCRDLEAKSSRPPQGEDTIRVGVTPDEDASELEDRVA
ncbi:hypothetical protein THAOC_31391, partial [Thalassiosira oceanica]